MKIGVPKGFVFAGCSFTHGYGLQYYHVHKNLDMSLTEYDIPFRNDLQSGSEMYRRFNRFANIVSTNFNTWHITREGVSGCDFESILFLDMIFGVVKPEWWLTQFSLKYKEVSHVIIQTTYPNRSVEYFKNDVNELNIKEEKEVVRYTAKRMTEKFKEKSKLLEKKGIKVYFIHATDEYQELFSSDEYLNSRTIKLQRGNNEYYCINDLMYDDRIANPILNDQEFFGTNVVEDYHPSLITHSIIANNIITRINNE